MLNLPLITLTPFTSSSLHTGVQRRQRRVLDTSSTYVRGEENLHGWRPRGDSLIFDHQWELEKLTRLEEVGRMRHLLLLRERLGMDTNPNPTTKTEKDVCNLAARAATSPVHMVIPQSPQTPVKDPQQILPEREYNQREQELMLKCLNLVQGKCSAFPPLMYCTILISIYQQVAITSPNRTIHKPNQMCRPAMKVAPT